MYIKLAKDIYDKVVTRKRTKKDITSKFPILIGLHQGKILNPYLFVLAIGVHPINSTWNPLIYAFANDIVLVDELNAESMSN